MQRVTYYWGDDSYCTWLVYDATNDGYSAQVLQGLLVTFLTETAGWNATAVDWCEGACPLHMRPETSDGAGPSSAAAGPSSAVSAPAPAAEAGAAGAW